MSLILKKRIDVDDQNLCSPLTANGGVGEYLRYEPIYDQIKEARREDEDGLSQGIWKTDLKRADWVLVESLCAKALEFQSKDLQVAGWLTESWIVMDRFKGLNRGISLVKDLVSIYWQNIYPQDDDGDLEGRVLLFDWMNEHFTNRLMFIPLTTTVVQLDKPHLHLADWIGALNFESLAKRSNDHAKVIAEAETAGKITLGIFRKTLGATDVRYLQRIYGDCTNALQTLGELRTFLESRLGKQTPTFSRIKAALEDVTRLSKTTLEQRGASLELSDSDEDDEDNTSYPTHENEKTSPSTTDDVERLLRPEARPSAPQHENEDGVFTINGRKDAYMVLKDIGAYLHTLDPHSPAPYILDMIVSWENKTLPEILEDLSQAPTNTQMLIRMLASSLPASHGAAIVKG
jgi:type VI secretion system protein ImpA